MALTVPRGAPQPGTWDATDRWRPQRRSALYARQVALGARFVDLAGWQVPAAFRPPEEEMAAARAGIGLVDLSALGKLRLLGRDAPARLAETLPDGTVPPPGRVARLDLAPLGAPASAGSSGGAEPQGLLLGLTPDELLLLTPPEVVERVMAHLETTVCAGDRCVHLADLTSTLLALGVVGPESQQLLMRATSLDVRPWRLPDKACAQGSVVKVPAILARDDRGALPTYLLLASRAYGEYLWDALAQVGDGLGIAPLGHEAWLALGG
ncbi:MAG TPA: hypothetical protein VIN09_11595 [Chloroflexota bacterium]